MGHDKTPASLAGTRLCSFAGAAPSVDDLGRVADAGFDTAVVAGLSPSDLAALSKAARRLGLAVLADLALDRIPAAQAAGAGGLFVPLPSPVLDPRLPPAQGEFAAAALGGADDAAALAAWGAGQVAALRDAGASGVRLMGLANLPGESIPHVLHGLRAQTAGAVLFAWTQGVGWDTLRAVTAGDVDLVASSFPFWDGQASWLWTELSLLRRIAPVVVPVDAPGSPHAALAAMLADGWLTRFAPDGPVEADAAVLNRLRGGGTLGPGPARLLSAPESPVTVLLRTDTYDPRQAATGTLLLCNTTGQPARLAASAFLPEAGGVFGPFTPLPTAGAGPKRPDATGVVATQAGTIRAGTTQADTIQAGAIIELAPLEVRLFRSDALRPPAIDARTAETAIKAAGAPRLAIEAPAPCVDAGRFPIRRTVGTVVEVQADIIGDGHDKLAAVLRWRAPGGDWRETPMALVNNDRWTASFPLECLGVHHYEVHAWRDAFTTYTDELFKKHKAGVPVVLELQEGAGLVARAAARKGAAAKDLAGVQARLSRAAPDAQREELLSPAVAALMAVADDRPHLVTLGPVPIQAERTAAGYASWYEVFPRSLSGDPDRHGTFRDVEQHLPRIAGMGFDVLYFPPIHPIGRVNRKGRNNTLTPAPDDPGSPYAIGSVEGGHDALHPELGTLDDFQHLRAACARHGLELAMDFAIQCSPDHPWLKQHKDWFTWRPDGSIRYAENPPKKYEDIVNVDFYADGAVPGLWAELCSVVMYWAGQGVRLFRVDNPHTKPLPFWEWMIAEVQAHYPDTVFLAEAFTRPKVMYRLAKAGFSQSYTYFTWREQKWEFEQYLTELTAGPPQDFFRPHFFVNTPDINPVYLQGAGRGAYLVRAALAATLSGLWGVYNGFELCEGTPVPGKEEYLDSEKYQLRAWDWDRPGNIVEEITQLNAIRRANPALHSHLGVTFLPATGEQVLFFEKATPDRGNVVLVAVSLDASTTQYADLTVSATGVVDLLTDEPAQWADRTQRVVLPPDRPYAIWRIRSGT